MHAAFRHCFLDHVLSYHTSRRREQVCSRTLYSTTHSRRAHPSPSFYDWQSSSTVPYCIRRLTVVKHLARGSLTTPSHRAWLIQGFFWLLVVELRPVRVLGGYRSSSTADTGGFTTLRRRALLHSVLSDCESQSIFPSCILRLSALHYNCTYVHYVDAVGYAGAATSHLLALQWPENLGRERGGRAQGACTEAPETSPPLAGCMAQDGPGSARAVRPWQADSNAVSHRRAHGTKN